MNKYLVVKFGGSVLQDQMSIKKCAESVNNAQLQGFKIVVVVSAIKGVTDKLLSITNAFPNMSSENLDEILSLGEEQSSLLMEKNLKKLGVDAIAITPNSKDWPIITDNKHGDAEPLSIQTQSLIVKKIKPRLNKNQIPIICGFIGKTISGKKTTLGRGGSDTTAVLLANYLNAEVVLVKDTGRIFSGDPKKIRDAIPLSRLDAEEANMLSSGGAKILHNKVFKQKLNNLNIRIVLIDDDITKGGTLITGFSSELEVKISEKPTFLITIIGDLLSKSNNLKLIFSQIVNTGIKITSITGDEKATILYLEGDDPSTLDKIHKIIKEKKIGKAVSDFNDLVKITIKGKGLETIPGLIQKITDPLAKQELNIYGIITVHSSINIFVKWIDKEKAKLLIEKEIGL